MAAERTRWTDERIDDFSGRLDRFETRVDTRFDRFEGEVDRRFDKVESTINQRLDSIDDRLHSSNRTMIAAMATIVAAVIAQIFFG